MSKFRCFIIFSVVSVLSIFTACGTKLQTEGIKTPKKGLNVSFYNVENLFDTIDQKEVQDEDFLPNGKLKWNSDRYKKKLAHIVEALSQGCTENPTLIGLVEVENKAVLQDLIKTGKFAETSYEIAHHDSPDERGIDVALLYDKKHFILTSSESLRIKIDSIPDFKTRDILYVNGTLDGTEMHIFVNHWPSRRSGEAVSEPKRIAAAMVVRAKVDEILAKDPKAKIIIMGDLNDHPDNKSINEVLKAKASSEIGADLYDLLADDHLAGRGTHSFQGKWGVLDHIIVSSSLLYEKNAPLVVGKDAQIVKAEILLYTQKDGTQKPSTTYGGDKYYGGYSDHLPVRIFLMK